MATCSATQLIRKDLLVNHNENVPARRQAGGNCRHLAFPSEKVCGLFRFDADEFFHGAMVDSAVAKARCVYRPRFAKLAQVIHRHQCTLVEFIGFPVDDLDFAAHEGEVQVLVDGDRVAVETPPPSGSTRPTVLGHVDASAVDDH